MSKLLKVMDYLLVVILGGTVKYEMFKNPEIILVGLNIYGNNNLLNN